MAQTFTLYHYWRSSSSWRVRWAMAYKGIPCEFVHINLLENQQTSEEHKQRNPMGCVPVLEIKEPGQPSKYLTESIAIIEYLEELYPTPALLPADPFEKAQVRRLAEIVNSGTQPLQNLTVMKMYSDDVEKRSEWSRMWIRKGLQAYEDLVTQLGGTYSFGDTITMADLYLIPQLYNANRFSIPATDFPTLARIQEVAQSAPGYHEAHPDRFQP